MNECMKMVVLVPFFHPTVLYVKPVPDADILFTIVTVYLSVFSLILVVYQFLVK